MASESDAMARIKDPVTGLLSLSLCLIPGISLSQTSNIFYTLNSYKELKSTLIISLHKFSEYSHKPIFFPFLRMLSIISFSKMGLSHPVDEEICIEWRWNLENEPNS